MKKITFTSLARLLGLVFLWMNLGHAPDLHAQTVPAQVAVTATPGNGQVTLSWPLQAGLASPITGYDITATPSVGEPIRVLLNATATTAKYTVPNLANGTEYTFTVFARSATGDGPPSDPVPATPSADISATAPSLVSNLTAVANANGTITLAWLMPANGGSPLEDYRLQVGYDLGGGDEDTIDSVPQPSGTATEHILSAELLKSGRIHYISMRATNAVGDSPHVLVIATALVPPPAPAQVVVTATPGNGQVTLSWPLQAGLASPITGYDITATPSVGEPIRVLLNATATTAKYTVPSLANGTEYTFTVFARSATGDGPPSDPVPATPSADISATVPSLVSNLTAVAGNGEVTLSWIAPANGGSELKNYRIEVSYNHPSGEEIDLVVLQPSGTATTHKVESSLVNGVSTRLSNGIEYYFLLRAKNAIGEGPRHVTVRATPGMPGAVTDLAAVAINDGTVTLSWTAPANNGGFPVTGYKLQIVESGGTEVLSLTAIDIPDLNAPTYSVPPDTGTGLIAGTQYEFHIVATNEVDGDSRVGDGPDASTTATPVAAAGNPPDAVGDLTAEAGNTTVTLSWIAPANGGSDIIDYEIKTVRVGRDGAESVTLEPLTVELSSLTVLEGRTTYTVPSLVNGNIHNFSLTARNAAEKGPAATVSVTPGTPGQVPNLRFDPRGNGQVVLRWDNKPDDGGSELESYLLEVLDLDNNNTPLDPSPPQPSINSLAAIVPELTNGVNYEFRLTANNENGAGPSASIEGMTDTTKPAKVGDLTVDAGNGQITLHWTKPDAGDSDITGYKLTVFDVGDEPFTWPAPSADATEHTVGGLRDGVSAYLTNGSPYFFSLLAVNDGGDGDGASINATPDSSVPLATVPDAVLSADLTVVAADESVTLSWPKPANGGSTLQNYILKVFRDDDGDDTEITVAQPSGRDTMITVPNLTNGARHTFTLRTMNAVGAASFPLATVFATPLPVQEPVTGLTATPGNGQLTLNWTAPVNNNGAPPIILYGIIVTPDDGESSVQTLVTGTSTSYTVPNLTNGVGHTVVVLARNASGDSPVAFLAPETSTTPRADIAATAPAEVSNLTAAVSDGTVTLKWLTPANGGSSLTDYVLLITLPDGSAFPLLTQPSGTDITYTVSGLTNGTTYTFSLAATNAVGHGPAVSATATPAAAPGAVTNLTAVAGDGTVTLSWTPPDDGGSPLTEYVLTATSSDGSTVPPIPQPVVTTTTAMISHPVPGLTNGVLYTFALVARSLAGDSPSVSASATPAGLPDAINDLTAVAGDGTVTLSWTPPDDGGSPLTEYVLTATSSDGSTVPPIPQPVVTTTAMISHPVPGLTNGVLYTFALVARSLAGDSPSAEVPATPAGLPDAINDLTAVAGDGTVTLSWTPPDDGGSPLTEYVLTATSSDGSTVPPIPQPVVTTTAMISHPVPGLTNGITYTFSLSANNAVDDGPVVSATATPVPKPEAVTGLTSTPGNGQLTLNWTAPVNNNGAPPIILYGIIVTPDDGESSVQTLVTGTSTSYTVPNLTNGVGHTVVVFARNASGDSPVAFIAPETSTTPRADIAATAPSVVSSLTAVPNDDGTVTLEWLTPANGGSSLTDYVLLITLPDGSAFPLLTQPSGTDITYTVSGLTNGTTYTFSLAATNAVGHGPAVSATATPAAAPGAVTNLTAVAGDGQIMLTWSAPELNGSTLTGYKVDYPGFPALTVDASATSTTITGLTNGVAYTFNVTPQSTNGDGVQVEVTATPVIKKLQTITFILSSAGVVGDTLDLSATASSMLEVTYSSSNSSIAEVGTGTEEGKLILKAGGDAMITASQAGDAQYTATEVTQSITVSESVVLSVDVENTEIRVWPNPVATQLNISSGSRGKLSITLRNLTGQRLQEGELEGKGQIDVSLVPSGVYLLHIRTAEETTSYLIYKE